MSLAAILFWSSLAILFYCYIGYGLLLALVNPIRKGMTGKDQLPGNEFPISLVIPAFNESAVLAEKIRNTLELDYPKQLLKVFIVTDGSTDDTARIVQQSREFMHLHRPERKGKFSAIKHAMQLVDTPIVIFSDANALLNPGSIKKITRHFTQPGVGAVAGEKKIYQDKHLSGVGEAEGWYWKYESLMKRLDADFYTVVGAAGELFAIRTELFKPAPDEIILDDFFLSMNCCLQGYRIAYEPGAFAVELPSLSLKEEKKRKLRISAGAYQSIGILKGCLNFFKHPRLAFQYFSRRFLRWVFCPLLIPILFFSNLALALNTQPVNIYVWLFYAQVAFYIIAIIGWTLVLSGRKAGILGLPFYFLFMNYCLVAGFIRYLQGRQTAVWEKSVRMDSNQQPTTSNQQPATNNQ